MRSLFLFLVIGAFGCSGNEPVKLGAKQDAGADMSQQVSDAGTDAQVSPNDVGTTPDVARDAARVDVGTVADMADAGPSVAVCEPQTFMHQGKQRGYLLCTPSPLPAGPIPVVLGFHGGGGNARNWYNNVAMHELIAPAGAVMVYMQGCQDDLTDCATARGNFLWNVQKPGESRSTDDEAYTLEVIDRLSSVHGLNVGTLFAMGHSLGGMFTYTLRCDYPDLFAAIAPISATPTDGSCTAAGDTSIYHVHGADDPNVPFSTGCCSGPQQNMGSPQYLAACDSLPRCKNPTNWWPRVLDGMHPFADLVGLEEIATDALQCSSMQTQTPDHTECRALDGCRAGTGVEVCLVPGAAHALNTIEPAFDYRAYIWSRFERHL